MSRSAQSRFARAVGRVISIIPNRFSPEASMLFSANRRAFVAGLSSTLIGLSLDPASAAAKAKMKYDTDNDGTLDKKELGGRIGKDMMADADPDKDGTISKDEYLGLAEKLFKEADADGEGTLDAKELRSKAGRQLLKLLK